MSGVKPTIGQQSVLSKEPDNASESAQASPSTKVGAANVAGAGEREAHALAMSSLEADVRNLKSRLGA